MCVRARACVCVCVCVCLLVCLLACFCFLRSFECCCMFHFFSSFTQRSSNTKCRAMSELHILDDRHSVQLRLIPQHCDDHPGYAIVRLHNIHSVG